MGCTVFTLEHFSHVILVTLCRFARTLVPTLSYFSGLFLGSESSGVLQLDNESSGILTVGKQLLRGLFSWTTFDARY